MERFQYGYIYFVNLTPHTVVVRRMDGGMVEIPPSGWVARLDETREQVYVIGGDIKVTAAKFGDVYVLTPEGKRVPFPEAPKFDVKYITSALVMNNLKYRDVYAPGPAIRDDEGRVIACDGLSTAN